MKNLFILTVFALVALTSCKKDYTCECKAYVDGYYIDSESKTINGTKSKAADECDESDEFTSQGGYTVEVDCEIK